MAMTLRSANDAARLHGRRRPKGVCIIAIAFMPPVLVHSNLFWLYMLGINCEMGAYIFPATVLHHRPLSPWRLPRRRARGGPALRRPRAGGAAVHYLHRDPDGLHRGAGVRHAIVDGRLLHHRPGRPCGAPAAMHAAGEHSVTSCTPLFSASRHSARSGELTHSDFSTRGRNVACSGGW